MGIRIDYLKLKIMEKEIGIIGNGESFGKSRFIQDLDALHNKDKSRIIVVECTKEDLEDRIRELKHDTTEVIIVNKTLQQELQEIIHPTYSYSLLPGQYDEERNNNYSRKRPNINIVEEYKLIQLKQSKLCRSDRDWVEKEYNKLK